MSRKISDTEIKGAIPLTRPLNSENKAPQLITINDFNPIQYNQQDFKAFDDLIDNSPEQIDKSSVGNFIIKPNKHSQMNKQASMQDHRLQRIFSKLEIKSLDEQPAQDLQNVDKIAQPRDSDEDEDEEQEEAERKLDEELSCGNDSVKSPLPGRRFHNLLTRGEQVHMLVRAQLKGYCRTSPIWLIIVACFIYWIICFLALILPAAEVDKFDVLDQGFTRPLYPAFRYDEQSGEYKYSLKTIREQEQRWEKFFQYVDQTNTIRTNEKDEEIKSWTPLLDIMSPAAFYPINCFTSDKTLYDSTIIGYVKSESDLQQKHLAVLKNQFEDQRSIIALVYEIIDWVNDLDMEKIIQLASYFFPPEYMNNIKDSIVFKLVIMALKNLNDLDDFPLDVIGYLEMPSNFKILAIFGGGFFLPEFNKPSLFLKNFGNFKFKEFESKDDMFNYVRQEGYGWDADKPGICFALHWKQDDENKDYELELFFRDQFNALLAGTFSTEMPAAPNYQSMDFIIAVIRAFNSGMQNMQAYGANLLLQQLTGNNKASIVNAIGPVKIKWEPVYKVDKPYLILVPSVFSMIFFYGMLPFFLFFTYSIVSEKEQGVRAKLLSSGMTYKTYFFSWITTMSIINLIITLLITVPLQLTALSGWSFLILFIVFFLCGETIIALIWTVQALFNTARLSAMYGGFAYGASFMFSNVIRQQMPFMSKIKLLFACVSPLTAVKHTLERYCEAMMGYYGITFSNVTHGIYNFSTFEGIIMLLIDTILYCFIGYQIDQYFYAPEKSETQITAPFRFMRKQQPNEIKIDEEDNFEDDRSTKFPTTRNLVVRNLSLPKIKFRNSLKGMIAELKVSPQQDQLYYGSQADILSQKGSVQESEVSKYINSEGLSFQMRRSQVMCFLGGYEKDTSNILQAICGKLEVESNQVFLNGRDINKVDKSFVTQQVSYCKTEEYTLFEKLTASENIQIFSNMAQRANIEEISEISNKFIDQKKLVEQMNQAERSMLELLVTLLCLQKQILVLDEPTLYFNHEERDAAVQLIRSYKKGRFVLIKCCHDPTLIDLLADKYVVFPLDPSLKIKVNKYNKVRKPNRIFKIQCEDIDQMPKLVTYLRKQFLSATFQITTVSSEECTIVCTSDGKWSTKELLLCEKQSEFAVQAFEELEVAQGQQINAFKAPAQFLKFNSSTRKQEQQQSEQSEAQSPIKIPTQSESLAITPQPEKTNFLSKMLSISRLVKLKKGVPLRKEGTCCKQFGFFLKKMRAQNRHKLVQYISIYLFPALLVTIGYLSSRYYYTYDSESKIMSPDWFPLKQPVLINNETVADGIPTIEIMKYFPDYENSINPKYAPVNRTDEQFYWFREASYEFSAFEQEMNEPQNYGNYLFYKMDKENHDYQMLTLYNISSFHSMNLFPQFAYEATLRYAMEDPDINFKVRSTPLPGTADIQRRLFTGEELFYTKHNVFIFQNALTNMQIATSVLMSAGIAYMMIGTVVIVTILQEKPDKKDKARIQSSSWKVTTTENTNKCAYWSAHYLNDLTYFIPCTAILLFFILIFDRYMTVAMICIVLFPFYFLPLLYVFSYTCKEERKAIFGVAMFLLLVLTFGGVFLMIRFPPPFEVFGDAFYDWSKYFPTYNLSRSIMFSGKMLEILDLYRERSKTGLGDSIDPDEWSMNNGKGDIFMSLIQTIFWWTILLVFIELQLVQKIFCCCRKSQKNKISHFQQKQTVQIDQRNIADPSGTQTVQFKEYSQKEVSEKINNGYKQTKLENYETKQTLTYFSAQTVSKDLLNAPEQTNNQGEEKEEELDGQVDANLDNESNIFKRVQKEIL